jgi:hypothetical protein
MRGRMWKPGQRGGTPTGHCGEYGTAMKLAREAAPDAVRRLIELMNSEDERVAVVACNSILDRAFRQADSRLFSVNSPFGAGSSYSSNSPTNP